MVDPILFLTLVICVFSLCMSKACQLNFFRDPIFFPLILLFSIPSISALYNVFISPWFGFNVPFLVYKDLDLKGHLSLNVSIWYYNFPSQHCFKSIPQILIHYIFIFYSIMYVFISFETSILVHGLLKSLIFNFQLFGDFLVFLHWFLVWLPCN